jgi:PadR family transcriptional regulator PadR
MSRKTELIQGTLDMLVLRILSRGELHGWGITQRMEALSRQALQVDEGSLYPALYRMEDKGWLSSRWTVTEKGRRAKVYALTAAGRRQLEAETQGWERMTAIVARVMASA